MSPSDHDPDPGPEDSLDERLAALLSNRLARAQAEDRLPSVAATIVRDGAVVWTGTAGRVDGTPSTHDTQYRIGSITKTVVAVAIMRLRDEGLLSVEDPVAEHLGAAWAPATADRSAPLGRATVGQLLMHTAGLPAETSGPWWERTPGGDAGALAHDLASRQPACPPGRRFHYSNVGYAVLGAVLTHHRGRPWAAVVQEEVLHPLGMDRTSPRPQPPFAPGLAVHPWADAVLPEPEHDAGAMAPAGQLWSTMADLGRWVRFLAGDTGDVLAPETLAEMSVPGAVDDQPDQPWTGAHGLGLQIFNSEGRRLVGHGGSMPGFLAGVQVEPATGLGLAVATNTTAGLNPTLARDLLGLMREHAPSSPTPWPPPQTSPHTPAEVPDVDLTGLWYWGPSGVTARLTGDVLSLAPLRPPGRPAAFERVAADHWMGQDGYFVGEPLRVVRSPDGAVAWLDLASYILTRTPYDPQADQPGGVDDGGWRRPT